jgi:hypothetical protein
MLELGMGLVFGLKPSKRLKSTSDDKDTISSLPTE